MNKRLKIVLLLAALAAPLTLFGQVAPDGTDPGGGGIDPNAGFGGPGGGFGGAGGGFGGPGGGFGGAGGGFGGGAGGFGGAGGGPGGFGGQGGYGGYGGQGGFDPTQAGGISAGGVAPAPQPVDPLETIRQAGSFTNEEWVILRPKIQRVYDTREAYTNATTSTLDNASMRGGYGGAGGYGGGGYGGAGGYGGPGGYGTAAADPATPPDPVVTAKTALDTSILDYHSTTAMILVRLKALRSARAATRAAYVAAQKDLIPLLTVRQEGILVNIGLIE